MHPHRQAAVPLLVSVPLTHAALGVVTLFCVTAVAQDPSEPQTELVISPRSVQDPALTPRLFPSRAERQPGNAAVILLRLPVEVNTGYWTAFVERARRSEFPGLLRIPAESFDVERVRSEVPLWFADELRRAAYMRHVDWKLPIDDAAHSQSIVTPHVVVVRAMLTALAVHCRADIIEGRLDSASEKLAIAFAAIGHAQDGPLLFVKYVQALQMGVWLDRVEELISAPGAPNLYWALTALPGELIELRTPADHMTRPQLMRAPSFDGLDRAHARAQWAERIKQLDLLAPATSEPVPRSRREIRREFAELVSRGRKELPVLDASLAETVPSMPDDEIAVRYMIARYAIGADRIARALLLPPYEGLPLLRSADEQVDRDEHPMIRKYIPSALKEYVIVWAMRRRVDALRVVEAIRHYAAENGGMLPESLDDITAVPLPRDVFTDQPFEYKREGATAILSAGPVRQWGEEALYEIRYVIRIR